MKYCSLTATRLAARRITTICLLASAFAFAGEARAATYNWTGAASAAWSQPGNWSPPGVPGADDSAVIGAGKVVDVATNIVVKQLSVGNGSTLRGSGNITVSGLLGLKGAVLSGAGIVRIPVGAVINFDRGSDDGGGLLGGLLGGVGDVVNNLLNVLVGKVIQNSGVANLNSGDLAFGTNFYNNPGAVFNLNSDSTLRSSGLLAPMFSNAGTLKKNVGAGSTTLALPFQNSGVVDARSGIIKFSNSFIQTGGSTQLNGGHITATGLMDLQGGQLQGTGRITGNVRSRGSVKPGHSPGAISIIGNYTQTSGGSLDMEIAGLSIGTQYDTLSVTGTAQIAGALNLFRLGSPLYVPPTGTSFELLSTAGGLQGRFSTINGVSIGSGKYFRPSYGETCFAVGTSLDSAKPTVLVTSPAQGATYSAAPASTAGSATDSGGGLDKVTIVLARFPSADSKATPNGYWNWTTNGFGSSYSAAAHERACVGKASWAMSLPFVPSGFYGVRATAIDVAGNSTASVWVRYTVPLNYYTIAGRVSTSSGTALAGVTLKRTGSNSTIQTNSAGYFAFTGVANGTYTLTASKSGKSFTPSSKTVTVNGANLSNQNFIGSG